MLGDIGTQPLRSQQQRKLPNCRTTRVAIVKLLPIWRSLPNPVCLPAQVLKGLNHALGKKIFTKRLVYEFTPLITRSNIKKEADHQIGNRIVLHDTADCHNSESSQSPLQFFV